MTNSTTRTIAATALLTSLACSSSALAAEDICKTYETQAASIMLARQSGVPLSETIERYQSDPRAKTLKQIILRAYGYARRDTEEGRKERAAEFANDIALDCYKAQK